MAIIGEVVTAFASFSAVVFCLTAVVSPMWVVSDPNYLITEEAYKYLGLWKECHIGTGGSWSCDDFDSFFLTLPIHIQAGRGFGIVSVLSLAFAFACSIVAIKGMSCAPEDATTRNRLRLVSCLLNLIGGVCILSAAIWWTVVTIHEYYIARFFIEQKMSSLSSDMLIPGYALFIAFTSGIVAFIAAIVGACVSCNNEENSTNYAGYNSFQRRKDQPRSEYV